MRSSRSTSVSTPPHLKSSAVRTYIGTQSLYRGVETVGKYANLILAVDVYLDTDHARAQDIYLNQTKADVNTLLGKLEEVIAIINEVVVDDARLYDKASYQANSWYSRYFR